MKAIRVNGRTNPKGCAGAIAKALRRGEEVTVQAMGPHAVNQAVKALAVARGFLAGDGIRLTCSPDFETVLSDDGDNRSGIIFSVFYGSGNGNG